MTVGDLREILASYDARLPIVVARFPRKYGARVKVLTQAIGDMTQERVVPCKRTAPHNPYLRDKCEIVGTADGAPHAVLWMTGPR